MVSLLLALIYLAFIGLGLPDGLLGAAWPLMNAELAVPLSYAGIISTIISIGTIVSSLLSDRLTRRFKAGLITAVSVLLTAVALFGFALSPSFLWLCVCRAVRSRCGQRGCRAEQLRSPPLHLPPYELAPLFLGCRRRRRAVYHGMSNRHTPRLARRIRCGGRYASGVNGGVVSCVAAVAAHGRTARGRDRGKTAHHATGRVVARRESDVAFMYDRTGQPLV